MRLWCRVQGCRYRRCQETGRLLRDWRFGRVGLEEIKKRQLRSSFFHVSPCLSCCVRLPGLPVMQSSVLWSATDFIPVPFGYGWLNMISSVIDSARWERVGNKCVVREIRLALFHLIMLKHCHWWKSLRSCLWFCRAQWAERGSHTATVIAVIPIGVIHIKMHMLMAHSGTAIQAAGNGSLYSVTLHSETIIICILYRLSEIS